MLQAGSVVYSINFNTCLTISKVVPELTHDKNTNLIVMTVTDKIVTLISTVFSFHTENTYIFI